LRTSSERSRCKPRAVSKTYPTGTWPLVLARVGDLSLMLGVLAVSTPDDVLLSGVCDPNEVPMPRREYDCVVQTRDLQWQFSATLQDSRIRSVAGRERDLAAVTMKASGHVTTELLPR
jgi:hypothetical protein